MLHTKFRGNRPAGSGEKDFEGFLPYIYGCGCHLGQVTSPCHQIFISLYLKAFIKNLVQIGKVVSEKIRFEYLYVHNQREHGGLVVNASDSGSRGRGVRAPLGSNRVVFLSKAHFLPKSTGNTQEGGGSVPT